MQIEYDEKKSAQNFQERGFGFDLVHQFDFAGAFIADDDRHDYGEPRARAWGRIDGLPYCVAFTMRGDVLRVITMHRIHEKEAKRYGI